MVTSDHHKEVLILVFTAVPEEVLALDGVAVVRYEGYLRLSAIHEAHHRVAFCLFVLQVLQADMVVSVTTRHRLRLLILNQRFQQARLLFVVDRYSAQLQHLRVYVYYPHTLSKRLRILHGLDLLLHSYHRLREVLGTHNLVLH